MKKYLTLFKLTIQESLAYRVDFIMPVFSTFIKLLLLYFLWKVTFEGAKNQFGYTFDQMFSYYLFVSLIETVVSTRVDFKMADEIRDGRLSLQLIKPHKYFFVTLFTEWGEKILQILFSGFGVLLLFIIYGQLVSISYDSTRVVIFLIFVVLGYVINLLLGLMIGCIGFWMTHIGGFISFINQPISFLGGAYFPLEVLGIGFLTVTPFAFTKYVPAKVMAGEYSSMEIFFRIIIACIWISVLYFVYKLAWKAGMKKYDAVGQ